MGTENEETRVVRSLEEGPDYAPDWRQQVVQAYLADVAVSKEPLCRLQEICWMEKDPYVRQYLRFRYDGHSVNIDAFRYAEGCRVRNAETGAASMIKAMILGDRTPEEIATELGTEVRNIVTFAKVFFDIRRYLNNENLLRRVALHDAPAADMAKAEAQRERRWLSAAFHRGWTGVEQVVFQRQTGAPEELDQLSSRLQSTLASRALEYVHDLESSGLQPCEADLQRFLSARSMQGPQGRDGGEQQLKLTTFVESFWGAAKKKADSNPDDPSLDGIREIRKRLENGEQRLSDRRRTRFTGS